MAGGALGPLVRHPVHRSACTPALIVGVGAGSVLRLLAEIHPVAVPDGVDLTVLLLAIAAVPAVVDPAGSIADAMPTRLRRRRGVRIVLVLFAVLLGWSVALSALPPSFRPSLTWSTGELAALCAVVLAAAAVEVRSVPRTTDPLGAAVVIAMAWTALWLLRPAWSPFAADGANRHWLFALAGSAAVVLGLASSDPARPTWRSLRPRRPAPG